MPAVTMLLAGGAVALKPCRSRCSSACAPRARLEAGSERRAGAGALPELRGLSSRGVRGSRLAARAGADPVFNVSEAAAIATLDSLIDSMLAAHGDAALTPLVQANVLSLDVKFFLRLAARADTAGERDKAALTELASKTMRLLDGVVEQTRKQMSSSSEVLTRLVGAAADEGTGAFVLPLRADRLAAIRSVLDESPMDEAVLSNAFAWMRKASDDGMDGMVLVIQKVLQLWAGRQLARPGAGDAQAEALLQRLLAAAEESWDGILSEAAVGQAGVESGLAAALQQRMEGVVLGLPNGSYAQRVQAEYLKEVEARVKAAFGKKQ